MPKQAEDANLKAPSKIVSTDDASSQAVAAASANSATVTVDALGSFGAKLTAYHVGDLTGILGLLISFFGLWWTYREAREARKASLAAKTAAELARDSANRALGQRDRLEVTSILGELAARLRELRDLTQSDDWVPLSFRFDAVASLCIKLLAAGGHLDEGELKSIDSIRSGLRQAQTETNGIKDASKRQAQKRKLFGLLMEMVDQIESTHTKRLKDGPW